MTAAVAAAGEGCGDKLLARSRFEENRDNNNAPYTWDPDIGRIQESWYLLVWGGIQ